MKAQARASTAATPKPTADYVRSRLRETKERIMKEPRGRRELCRLLVERAVDRTVESLVQSKSAEGIRQKRRGKKHQRTRSGSGRSYSEVDGAADESHVQRTAVRRPGALCHSGFVAMQQHLSMAWWLTFPHLGAKIPFRSEREARTLAKSLDLIIAGRLVAAAWEPWRTASGQPGATWKSSLSRFRRSGSCRRSAGSWSRLRQVAASPSSQPQRADMDFASTVGQWQPEVDYKQECSYEGEALGRVGPEKRQRRNRTRDYFGADIPGKSSSEKMNMRCGFRSHPRFVRCDASALIEFMPRFVRSPFSPVFRPRSDRDPLLLRVAGYKSCFCRQLDAPCALMFAWDVHTSKKTCLLFLWSI